MLPFSMAFFTLSFSAFSSFSHFLDCLWRDFEVNLRSNIWFISLSVLPMLIDFSLHVLWNSIDVYRRKLTNRELGFSSNLGKISQRVMDEEEEEASRRNLIKRGPSSLVFLNLIGLSRFNLNVIVGSTRFSIVSIINGNY